MKSQISYFKPLFLTHNLVPVSIIVPTATIVVLVDYLLVSKMWTMPKLQTVDLPFQQHFLSGLTNLSTGSWNALIYSFDSLLYSYHAGTETYYRNCYYKQISGGIGFDEMLSGDFLPTSVSSSSQSQIAADSHLVACWNNHDNVESVG